MKSKVTDSIFAVLLLCILTAALFIWPVGLLKVTQEYKSLERGMAPSGPITESASLSGIFQPVTSKLNQIGIRFSIPNRDENTGILMFQLTDAQGSILYTEEVPLCEMQNNKYYAFKINQKLDTTKPYIYQITCRGYGDNPPTAWLGSPKTACAGQLSVYYSGGQLTGNALMMQCTYAGAASFRQSLPYEITLLALAILLFHAWKGEKTDD